MKMKHLFIAAAVSAFSGLSLMAESAAPATETPTTPAVTAAPKKGEGHGKMMQERLGLNEEQAQKLKALFDEAKQARESVKAEFEAIKTKEQQLRKEREALRTKVEQKHKEIIAKAKAFLTDEQYKKLMEMGENMKKRAGFGGRDGHRGPDAPGGQGCDKQMPPPPPAN